MSDPGIVTPQEAQAELSWPVQNTFRTDLLRTIATELDRINTAIAQGYEAGLEDGDADASKGEELRTRAAVVKALRGMGDLFAASGPYPQGFAEAAYCNERADAIETGADW